jgi:hypothetical protein
MRDFIVNALKHLWKNEDGFLGLGSGTFSGQAGQQYNQANTAAGQYGSAATNEGAQLNPFLSQEMKAKHLFDPNQVNEMLTAADAGAGGATGALTGQAGLEAQRTHNSSGFTKTLDDIARDKSKALAGTSEGIASEDVMGAKNLNQQGAAGLQGLYGTNVGAQMKAMGLADQDINTELKAQEAGPTWLHGLSQFSQGLDLLNGTPGNAQGQGSSNGILGNLMNL